MSVGSCVVDLTQPTSQKKGRMMMAPLRKPNLVEPYAAPEFQITGIGSAEIVAKNEIRVALVCRRTLIGDTQQSEVISCYVTGPLMALRAELGLLCQWV